MHTPIRLLTAPFLFVSLALAAAGCGGPASLRQGAWQPRSYREDRFLVVAKPAAAALETASVAAPPRYVEQAHREATWTTREPRAERVPIARPSLRPIRH